MTSRNELYECEHCGNIVEVVRAEGPGPSVRCCDQAMTLYAECEHEVVEKSTESVESEMADGILVLAGDGDDPLDEEAIMVWIDMG